MQSGSVTAIFISRRHSNPPWYAHTCGAGPVCFSTFEQCLANNVGDAIRFRLNSRRHARWPVPALHRLRIPSPSRLHGAEPHGRLQAASRRRPTWICGRSLCKRGCPAFLLASLLTLLLLIFWEVRSQRPTPEPQPAKPKAVRPPRAEAAGPGTMPRPAVIIGLMIVAFAAIGLRFGVPVAATVLALTIAILLRSLWYTGPAILARCGARPVRDPNLIEAVAELAAKAGIAPPRILEIEETHPNAFALGTDGADAAIVVTLGLRRRLTTAEQRAVIAHEMSHIVGRDAARATLGVTLMGAVAALALWLGVAGRTAPHRGVRALDVPGGAGAGFGAGAAARRVAGACLPGRPRGCPACAAIRPI